MTVLIMVACTSAFAQERMGLEQFYQQNGSDAMPTRNTNPIDYNDLNDRQDRCVNPTQNNYNDDAMGEGRYKNWNEVDPENCSNDPEACNCLNHGDQKNGQLSDEPIYRGSDCVPVQVYDWNAGEKMWFESGQEYPPYWCEPIQEETQRDNYNDDGLESENWNYEHPDYWKTHNPEAGDPDYIKNKDDDGLQRRGGGPNGG